MMPSLLTTTALAALAFFALGVPFLLDKDGWRNAVKRFPRSENAGYVLMGIGGLWFLYKMWFLGPQDELFGPNTRLIFIAVFGFGFLGSFAFLKDFLAVRGLAICILMLGFFGLKPAFGLYEVPSRLVLVSLIYVLVAVAIVLGWSPFYLRNVFEWLYRDDNRTRSRAFGCVLLVCGMGLALSTLGY